MSFSTSKPISFSIGILAGQLGGITGGGALLAMLPPGGTFAHAHGNLGNLQPSVPRGVVAGFPPGALPGNKTDRLPSDGSLRLTVALLLIISGIQYLRAKDIS